MKINQLYSKSKYNFVCKNIFINRTPLKTITKVYCLIKQNIMPDIFSLVS